jgi:hypothetical protein
MRLGLSVDLSKVIVESPGVRLAREVSPLGVFDLSDKLWLKCTTCGGARFSLLKGLLQLLSFYLKGM